VVSTDPLVLAAELPLAEAARRILSRDPESRYHDALVEGADGPLVVSVAAIFERLTVLFQHAALHDPLTGLPNRRLLEQYGGEHLADGRDPGRIAILYVDLDGFKLVNDTFGHRVGDHILVSFGERLRSCVRPHDVVSRLGGDEFAAMLFDVTELQAMAVAERILLSASAPFIHAEEPLFVSASVGVAIAGDVSPERGFSQLDALLQLADEAMLLAKRNGKHRVERSLGEIHSDTLTRRRLILRQLRAAMNRDQGLHLCYQPQLDLATGGTSAVEALLRWNDPELGAVSPAEFIPIAEETDQINRLGQWVLHQACAQARSWAQAGQPRVVSVNVSPVQLRSPHFVASVQNAMTTAELPPHLLRIEITETSAVLDMHTTMQALRILRGLGVQIELDDFGTGYSSLSMLRDLPLAAVKIDQSFIDRIDTEPAGAALVKGVLEAAHALGLTATAEGVERPEQLAILREMGCDTAQGFLIARPTTAAALTTNHQPPS